MKKKPFAVFKTKQISFILFIVSEILGIFLVFLYIYVKIVSIDSFDYT